MRSRLGAELGRAVVLGAVRWGLAHPRAARWVMQVPLPAAVPGRAHAARAGLARAWGLPEVAGRGYLDAWRRTPTATLWLQRGLGLSASAAMVPAVTAAIRAAAPPSSAPADAEELLAWCHGFLHGPAVTGDAVPGHVVAGDVVTDHADPLLLAATQLGALDRRIFCGRPTRDAEPTQPW